MNRPVRLLLSLAATSCGLIPFESSAPASAATAPRDVPALVHPVEQGPVAHAPAAMLIERSPDVQPTSEPLDFAFAVFDAVLGN